jgi:hypothetical protein
MAPTTGAAIMPFESIVASVAVVSFFAVFALTLAWGVRRAGAPK